MEIRTFKAGDESTQASIYNEAAASLPKFKSATADEIRRRCQEPHFDPAAHFFAEDGGNVVGYAGYLPSGRVSYPWCRRGRESAAEPLFAAVLDGMRARGLKTGIAAYRGDWTEQLAFFEQHGFQKVRDIVNFVLDILNMPTRSTGPIALSPLQSKDLPALIEMAPTLLGKYQPDELEKLFFHNPYYGPESYFVLRGQNDEARAVGVLVANSDYADPKQVDPSMPCYRLGAFGSEGMPAKRIDGLFSFLTPDRRESTALALVLLETAAQKQEDRDESTLAAQVPSDAAHLHTFYNRYFRRQGSFPVYEKKLD